MKFIYSFSILFLVSFSSFAQSDVELAASLKKNINFLASDKLEGRRVGTAGEQKAYKMIVKSFKQAGLTSPNGIDNFLQPFNVYGGKSLGDKNSLTMNKVKLQLGEDYYPLPYSSLTKTKALLKLGLINLQELKKQEKANPHFDFKTAIQDEIAERIKGGKNFVALYNDVDGDFKTLDASDKTAAAAVPVIYFTEAGAKKASISTSTEATINFTGDIKINNSTGHNVVGFINNDKPYTVVLGAHYDHLGYGEDHNSLYTGKEKLIHNGADDNASGTSALIELAKWTKTSASKNYNYLFVAFSGEELGLFGSKYFVENSPIPNENINYMINMDMVGRLNADTKALAIGGYGTSPSWGDKIKTTDSYFTIKQDSSGSGPSDHTSFYRKDIPVLFFFTGTHSDYHKPTDDADKVNLEGEVKIINYIKDLISYYDTKPKLAFLKTREAQMGKSSFKVSLGIFPDYTYSGKGVRVDGVTEGRAAEKAGVKVGDILIKLGDHEFTDVMSYMGALNKFEKGSTTKLILMRGNETLTMDITF